MHIFANVRGQTPACGPLQPFSKKQYSIIKLVILRGDQFAEFVFKRKKKLKSEQFELVVEKVRSVDLKIRIVEKHNKCDGFFLLSCLFLICYSLCHQAFKFDSCSEN